MNGLDLTQQNENFLIDWVKTETGRRQDLAFEELVRRHQLIIYKFAHKYHFKDYEFGDKVNVFTSCLFKAILKYDAQRKAKLITYYHQIVKHEVFLINQHQSSKKRGGLGYGKRKELEMIEESFLNLSISTEQLIKEDLKQFTERSNPKENPHQQVIDELVTEQVRHLIKQEEDEVNRYLLEGYLFHEKSIKEMANMLGFKHSATSQRLRRGLGRLQVKLSQQGWS